MIEIREANIEDVPFIASVILLAESTGNEITTYSKMFAKPNEELKPIIEKIVNNPTKNHPLCYSSYLIATYNGELAGAISVYVEGVTGDSNHLMTGALMSGFDRNEIQDAFRFLGEHKDIQISKTKGTLQIDCVATLSKFGGKGIFSKLLDFAEKKYKFEGVKMAEIQVWKKNEHAVNVYLSRGYKIVIEKQSKTNRGNGKILMQKML